MGELVVMGAELVCPFGSEPSVLTAESEVLVTGALPAATIMMYVPEDNIPSFGMCDTLSNPEVEAATDAADGVLTPQACVPVLTAPWVPGSPVVLIEGQPALTNTSTCVCAWGGVITVSNPGQEIVTTVP